MGFKNKYLITLILSILFFSCNKPNSSNPSNSCKITKIIYTPQTSGGGGYVECNFTYTGNNISKFDFGNGVWLFTYDAFNRVKRHEVYFAGDPQIVESHTFVEGWGPGTGFAVLSIDSSFYNGQFQATGRTAYNYNNYQARDYITSVQSNNSYVIYDNVDFTWQNGDPITAILTDPNTSFAGIDSISYDLTKTNKFNQLFPSFIFQGLSNSGEIFSTGSKYMLYHFMSKHMVSKVTITGDPYYKMVGNFTYTYNAQDLVKEIKLNGTTVMRFFYSCD